MISQPISPQLLMIGVIASTSMCAPVVVGAAEYSVWIQDSNAETLTNPSSQQASRVDPQLWRLRLDDLDSDDYQTRLRAAEWFRTINVPHYELERSLSDLTLSLEQRHQLLAALNERILNSPPAAMGVTMDMNDRLLIDGVRLVEVWENMPAASVLKRGDLITHIDGFPISNNTALREVISDYQPGQIVRITLKRPLNWPDLDSEVMPMDVDLELGMAKYLGDDHMDVIRRERAQRVAQLIEQFSPRAAPLEVPVIESRVDGDPRIQRLLEQLRQLKAGELRMTPQLTAEWVGVRNELARERVDPNLSADERAQREEIYRRYCDLLQ